jgi:hypothetical protein
MDSANNGGESQRHEETPNTPFGEDITNPDSRTIPLRHATISISENA